MSITSNCLHQPQRYSTCVLNFLCAIDMQYIKLNLLTRLKKMNHFSLFPNFLFFISKQFFCRIFYGRIDTILYFRTCKYLWKKLRKGKRKMKTNSSINFFVPPAIIKSAKAIFLSFFGNERNRWQFIYAK